MHPVLFEIGNFPVRSFGLMLLVGFFVGTWLAMRRAPRHGIDKEAIATVAVWGVIAGVLGARLFWVAQEWGHYSQNPGEIFRLTEGGMTSYGGVLFGMLPALIWCYRAKVRFAIALDLLAAPALVMHGFGRIGCFLNGCCYGSPCDLPWAVTVHPEVGTVYLGHPAQLYDTLMSFAGAILLLVWEARLMKDGRYAGPIGLLGAGFFLLYGVARFVYEQFRAGFSSLGTWGLPITDAQVLALAMFLIGVVWMIVALQRRRAASP